MNSVCPQRDLTTTRHRVAAYGTILMIVAGAAAAHADDGVPDVLRTYCLGCHNNVEREAGVSLMSAATIAEGAEDGVLLDKDDPSASRLLQVLNPEADSAMPPDGEPQPSAQQRELLRRWVLQGAPLSASIAEPHVPEIAVKRPSAPVLSSVRVSDDEVCIGGLDRVVRLNPVTGEEVWVTSGRFGKVAQLSVSADGRWIVAACGTPGVRGQAVILRSDNGELTEQFSGHADAVYAAVLDPAGTRLATAGYDRTILIHDRETKDVLRSLTGHNGSVFDLAFDASGEVLCSASADATIKVWSVATGERLDTLSQPQSEQYCVAVTPDGRSILAAGADNRIRQWALVSRDDARINPLLSSTFGHEETITSLALSPSGDQLATAAEDGSVRLWSMQPFVQQTTLPRQKSLVTSLTFLGEQQLLITRLDGSTHLQTLEMDRGPAASGRPEQKMVTVAAASQDLTELEEAEDNDSPESAQPIAVPARVSGVIHQEGSTDRDCYRFAAVRGQTLIVEITAERNKSPLDSVVEILDESGQPVLRTQLQAVRDSWFTFRGKDSSTADDFRVFYWQEMELNDFLYSDGEVVRLWQYPRGPDSGFKVYPGFGSRQTWFDTTPTAHALLAPCYVVVPHGPEETITPNGLPVFPVYYRNDDDAQRQRGRDSRLFFTAPRDGQWVVRVTDARGFQGSDYTYQLDVRAPQPDYKITFNNRELSVAEGIGQELEFSAERIDGFSGPITIDSQNLPPGFSMSGAVVIEEHQLKASACLYAGPQAEAPAAEQLEAVKFVATAEIDGEAVTHELTGLKGLTVQESPKLRVHIESEDGQRNAAASPLQLTIRPGQTIRAFIRLERLTADGIVKFGKVEAGRNMPHGVFVDNTGLNGLLLPADTSEREFFITAAPIVTPGRHQFFLKSDIDGITSLPVHLEVLPAESDGSPVATR